MQNLNIYVISDSTGETGDQVARVAISQYELDHYEIEVHPHVLELELLKEVLETVKLDNSIILHTLVSEELSTHIKTWCKEQNVPSIDLLTPLLDAITLTTHSNPLREPGNNHKLDERYFRRVAAIEFAVKYDDGKDARGIKAADLVLIGVSRTSKTPLSMFLANKNIKVANIPLVPEVSVPRELFEIPTSKIIGLTITPDKLNEIRQERLKALGITGNATYASMERILNELEYGEEIMKRIGCPIIDVSSKAIEETAGLILNILKENGSHVFKENY